MTVMTTFEISLNGKRLEASAANLQALLLAQGYDLKSAFACAINNTFDYRAWKALDCGGHQLAKPVFFGHIALSVTAGIERRRSGQWYRSIDSRPAPPAA